MSDAETWIEVPMKCDDKTYYDQYGRLWRRFPCTSDSVAAHAPRGVGVYQVLYQPDADSEPIVAYIGIATRRNTIRKRLQAHVAARSNWALGALTDLDRFSFAYFECDDLSAQQIEAHVTSTKKPPFNVKQEYKHFIESIAVH